jgi:protein-disulfide isomerase/uncharacterized membrane protein YphA (DoxX/SURF4 family)
LGIRLFLAAIWIWAAWSKLGDPRHFVQTVRAYDATPEWLSKTIGYGLPVLELTLAVLLVLGLIVRYAAAVSALLFTVFLIGIVQAAVRGIKIECGCFGGGGTSESTNYTWEILRDIVLLALAAHLVKWPRSKFSVDEAVIASEAVPSLTPKQSKSEKNVRRYKTAVIAAQQELQHKQRYIGAGSALVVILITFISIGVQGGRAKVNPSNDTANASASTGVRVGNQQAPVLVDLYEDFQCPNCKNLEATVAKDLAAKIKATSVKVNYHVMSFLDSASSGNRYSSRAANAGYCAADSNPAVFAKFHGILFGKDKSGADIQPAEGSNGRSDAELIAYGKQAGVTSADFSTCVTSNQHKELVKGVTEAASKRGVTGTPMVFVNGAKVEGKSGSLSVTDIDTAIAEALSKAQSTAAPSPTPSVKPSSKLAPPPKAPALSTVKPRPAPSASITQP